MLSSTELSDLREYQARQRTRTSFESWCRQCGFVPAEHHRLIIHELERAVEEFKAGHSVRLMILMPPGSAKSTYVSGLFPSWFLAQRPSLEILSCSHNAEFASRWGRSARNYTQANERWLGYSLKKDSHAVDNWEVSNGGRFFCDGVGAGLSGRRADCGAIDDFCGKEEDVNSKLFNDRVWDWYENDFVPRLKPVSIRVIIANHRNEDDLCGRIIAKEPEKWRIIKLRLLIETQDQAEEDPLGRKVGEHLWPDYFTKALVDERMSNPRSSGIEQQDPAPVGGAFFDREKLLAYTRDEYEHLLSQNPRVYAASDHAVSTKQTADRTCLGAAAFVNGQLYVLPDLVWDRLGPKQAVEAMLTLARTRRPLTWWAEKGHISKSIGPFLQDRMLEEKTFVSIQEVTPVKDKQTRAQSIKAMTDMGLVRFPKWCSWWQRAERELLLFPNGKNDDFVDFLALLGLGIARMTEKSPPVKQEKEILNQPWVPTMKWIKDCEKRRDRGLRVAMLDK